MDNSNNGGTEPNNVLPNDVLEMIDLDAGKQKKSTNSKDSIVKTARKKVPPLSPALPASPHFGADPDAGGAAA